MKYKIADHLQEIGTTHHGIVTNHSLLKKSTRIFGDENWYLIENDEIELVNHWVPEDKLELEKQTNIIQQYAYLCLFLIKYCNDLQKEIYCNQTILLSGPKSKHIYDFINHNLTDSNYTLPILPKRQIKK